jgi:hypothetical protein
MKIKPRTSKPKKAGQRNAGRALQSVVQRAKRKKRPSRAF